MQCGKASGDGSAGCVQELGSLGAWLPIRNETGVNRAGPGSTFGCCGPAWSQTQFNRDLRSKGKHRIQPAGRPRGVDDVAVPGGGSQGSFGSS